MAAWFLLALWTSVNSNAVQPTPFKHVQSAEPSVRGLIADGYARSETFRALVETVEQLPCVVYVSSTVQLSQGMRGALLDSTAGNRDMPVLRVLVKTNLSHEEAIAVIGHELQHVIEAVEALRRVSSDVTAAFEELAPTATGLRKYETELAVEVTARVRADLVNSRRRRPRGSVCKTAVTSCAAPVVGMTLSAVTKDGGTHHTDAQPPTPTTARCAAPFRVSLRASRSAITSSLVTAAVRELADVWMSNGVEVILSADTLNFSPQTAVTLILVPTMPPTGTSAGTLGWIGLQGPSFVPIIYVSLPATRALIEPAYSDGTPVPELSQPLPEFVLARALGRLAAHELGHYLLASRRHAMTGLMRSYFTAEELIADEVTGFRLRRADCAILAGRMRNARVPPVAPK